MTYRSIVHSLLVSDRRIRNPTLLIARYMPWIGMCFAGGTEPATCANWIIRIVLHK